MSRIALLAGTPSRALRPGIGLALLVILLDQLSKWRILALFRPDGVDATPFLTPKIVAALPFLDLVLTWNRGVSFGIGNGQGSYNTLVFTALAVAIGAALVGWMARSERLSVGLALGLVVGGAAGNVVDRLRYGAVVDFLYVHVGAFTWWPAFNLADSAISVGACLLVFDSLFGAKSSIKNSP